MAPCRALLFLFSQVMKMQNMITYPLYDFDMSEHVPFRDSQTCYLYDLFAVVVSKISFLLATLNS